MDEISAPEHRAGRNRIPGVYWLLGLCLVAYVALCTGNRENQYGLDAWEHVSALKALAENPWRPGHPLYNTDEPSVRYSPYLLGWALFSRATGLSSFETLSLAAVVNTALLVLGVAAFLKSLGVGDSAAAAVPIMVGLWGGPPGISNSYALSDLPWHEVNPSAFTFPMALFLWTSFKRFEREGWRDFSVPLMVALAGMMLIVHILTALLGMVGLWLLALTGESGTRRRLVACALLVGFGAGCLAVAWPWYSFLRMGTNRLPGRELVGINPYLTWVALSYWCVPPMVCVLFTLTVRDDRTIRRLVLYSYACYLIGFVSYVLPPRVPATAGFQRLPVPAMIFPHLALGIFAHRVGLFRPRTWPGRLSAMVRGEGGAALPQAVIETVFAIVLAYFLLPQFGLILKSPILARPFVAPILGREDKQLRIKSRLDHLLEPAGARDVILSDPMTMLSIPASKGRVVWSAYGQLLVADEEARMDDTTRFFKPETPDSERIGVLERYHIRWLLLNRDKLEPSSLFDTLYVDQAVVGRDREFVLMDADKWVRARRGASPAGGLREEAGASRPRPG